MPFAPSDLTGLKLWLKADAGLWQDTAGTTPASSDGDPVGRWADQSGQGNHATQATSGNRPALATSGFNGHPAVVFSAASSHFLTNASMLTPAGSALTAFVVFGSDAYATPFAFAGNGVPAGFSLNYTSAGGQFWTFANNLELGQFPDPSTTVRTYASRFDLTQTGSANRLAAWWSGVRRSMTFPLQPIANPLDTSQAGMWVGQDGSADYQHVNGPVLEVLVYDHALSDPEMAQVHAYVAAKWFAGLASSVICGGDSLTVSYPHNSTPWALTLGTLLGSGWVAPNPNTIATAETAATTTRIGQLAGANTDPRRQPYRPGDWYVLWGGINDLYDGATSAATVLANLIAIAQGRKDLGFRVAILTVTDRSDGPDASFAANRATLNNAIVAQSSPPWEFVVDLRATALDTAGATNDATLSNGDGVHLSQAGSDLVAQKVYEAFVANGVVPPPNTLPAAPTLSAGTPSDTGVTLTGSAFSDADGGDTHAASQWQVTLTGDTGFGSPVVSTGDDATHLTTYPATGLTASTAYRARARYKDSATGYSAWSSAATFTTAPTPIPGTPAGLAGSRSTVLTWSASSGATGYRVRRTLAGTTSTVYDGALLTFTDSPSGTASPAYTVTAYNGTGESAESSTVTPAGLGGGGVPRVGSSNIGG